jgi:threonylcarbamoyladenosine tRNA methylthiotransferase MtaB
MKKVAFYTLGCKLNYSETSTIARLFEKAGYEKVGFTEQPDIFVINTCSVTDNADKKCRKVVREALKMAPNAFIAIMGCYAQLKPTEIASIEGVDVVLGAAEKFRLLELIPTFVKQERPQAAVFHSDISKATQFYCSYSAQDRTRTFLKVQDGCNYACSFCTIPLARGESRSDSIANILDTARQIAQTGVREVVLTGVNIGDFGLQDNQRKAYFLDLIRQLDTTEGIDRFRISSIEPNLLKDEIIAFVASSQRFVPHFHIPPQSGSNKILRLMRRRYTRELYAQRIAAIKSLMPHCCIGVDVIVGFPGENHEDFLDTYHFLNDLDISYLHVFTYSERANTHAITLQEVVADKDRQERSRMLHILSDKKRRAFYESQLGQERTVLFEEDIEEGRMHGFTENYVRVSAQYDPMLINELKRVRLTGINEKGLAEAEECTPQLLHGKTDNYPPLKT